MSEYTSATNRRVVVKLSRYCQAEYDGVMHFRSIAAAFRMLSAYKPTHWVTVGNDMTHVKLTYNALQTRLKRRKHVNAWVTINEELMFARIELE